VLRSGESCHGSPPGIGIERIGGGGGGVIGSRERRTREGRVDLGGGGEEAARSGRGVSEEKSGH